MIIIHKIDDFLFDLFPKAKIAGMGEQLDIVKQVIEEFYTYGPFKPKVSIESGLLMVEVDTFGIVNQEADYKRVVSLCEKRRYSEAKPILQDLIRKNPTNSEYHRIFGQILSDEGSQEEAINCLIDALRWDPKNAYALIMMGNIFAREKDDFDTARKYYDQAIALNPKDNIAINNLGSNLLQLGRLEQGLEYLERAFELNPKYPNSAYGIALANDMLGNILTAFNFSITSLKNCGTDQNLANHVIALIIKTSEEWIETDAGKKAFNEYKSRLEKEGGKEIRVEEDNELPTAAKIEFAENYDREFHLIKYKPGYRAVEHLMMHELVHLDFVIQARSENQNKLFITTGEKKVKFITEHEKDLKELSKKGYSEKSLSGFISALFDGLNRQTYNAPIDLFIEDFLFNNFYELRPFQFVSLYGLAMEYRDSVTNKQVMQVTPKKIQYANRVMNLVFVLHFKDLFGFDLISKFNPIPKEIGEANNLFSEYKEYQHDREAGEEYELVQHWAEDLKVDKYFELVDEDAHRRRLQTSNLIESIENDPFGLESDTDFKQSEMAKFQKSQAAIGTNMAVVMFMLDALKYFEDKPKDKIKSIALEIAMLGTQGIVPGGDHKYRLAGIPAKVFSGYHLLAYYYVSWSIALPEMLSDLKLPYDKEFELAQQMFKE
jgi:tetratricopeptide (TPR) repeat protein